MSRQLGFLPAPRRWAALLALSLAATLAGCQSAERLAQVAPRLLAPSAPAATEPIVLSGAPPRPDLPAGVPSQYFDFESAGTNSDGQRRYLVRIRAGGSPSLVALSRLTPLFQVDGRDAVSFVSAAYFQAHPDRTPRSIQPGDEFILTVPADTFVVRWQDEYLDSLAQPARVHEYVSEAGDRLRYYLTDPFPLRYVLEPAQSPGLAIIALSPDLPYLLGSGRTDPSKLAQLLYAIEQPDLFQAESVRRLIAGLQGRSPTTVSIDRGRGFLDPVRAALARPHQKEPVAEPTRAGLTRAVFPADDGGPYAALEDALGTRTSVADLPLGQPFRIEYLRGGIVRVTYLTGPDDARGRRDPYELRENERWARLYARLEPGGDAPVKWGPGEPSDLAPFTSARDPLQRSGDPDNRYNYLVQGRILVLTFRPVRTASDVRDELELRSILQDARVRYRDQFGLLLSVLNRGLEANRPDGADGQGGRGR